MAIDLVSLVSGFFTPPLAGSLARTIGVNEAVARKLAAAAVPTVLAALASTAAARGGAQKLRDAVANSGPDALPKLAGAIDSGDAQALNEGADTLGALLGGSALSTLSGALGQYAGAPATAARSAVGAVARSVIGTIRGQDSSSWSDAASVAALFNSQRDAISAALAPEISRALAATGLLAGVAPPRPAPAPASARPAAPAPATAPAPPPPAPATSRGGFPTWAIILLIIIALAAIWWWLSQNQRPPGPAKQGAAPAAVEYAAAALMIPHWA